MSAANQVQGKLLRWNSEKHFGFIQPSLDGYENGVFLHRREIRAGGPFQVGDSIMVDIVENTRHPGKLECANAVLLKSETAQPAHIVKWIEGKGFGFAELVGNGTHVFVHTRLLGGHTPYVGEEIWVKVQQNARRPDSFEAYEAQPGHGGSGPPQFQSNRGRDRDYSNGYPTDPYQPQNSKPPNPYQPQNSKPPNPYQPQNSKPPNPYQPQNAPDSDAYHPGRDSGSGYSAPNPYARDNPSQGPGAYGHPGRDDAKSGYSAAPGKRYQGNSAPNAYGRGNPSQGPGAYGHPGRDDGGSGHSAAPGKGYQGNNDPSQRRQYQHASQGPPIPNGWGQQYKQFT